MLKRLVFLLVVFVGSGYFSSAQTSNVKGVLTDEYKTPIPNIIVTLVGTEFTATTDSNGTFHFKNVPFGEYGIETVNGINDYFLIGAKIEQPTVDLSAYSFEKRSKGFTDQDNVPTLSLSDDELQGNTSQSVASALNASRDAFVSATSYNFSVARFRLRGYDEENFSTLMNDAPMTDLANGRTLYNAWGGLNDVMRSREITLGLAPASYAFGSVGGVYSIDSRASHQRKQLQVSYSASNRAYDSRLMLTYGSGIVKGGWSYALSYSRRWADEGYNPGTFYDGHSYFASIEKFINNKHSLSLTLFGAATRNGRSAAAVQEMYDLAGSHYYNAHWGYQNGKKRNAVVGDIHRPVYVLMHEWNLNEKSSLETAVSVVSGKSKVSGLDWYNTTDPRPDYYRKLPSYVLSSTQDASLYQQTITYFQDEKARQINWDHLYNVNYHSGDTAAYVIADRIIDVDLFTLNTIYNTVLSDHTTFSGGVSYQLQSSEYYKELKDLMGGKYFVNLNQFADESTPGNTQHDLDNPNRKIYEGDKYSYNYVAHIDRLAGWMQGVYKFDKMDFFTAVQLSTISFYRTGRVRSGVFPNNSLGDSETQNFFNVAFKGGATYKVNGRNYLFVNGSYETRAPRFDDSFISTNIQNKYVTGLQNEKVTSVEGGYLLKSSRLKGRAVGYVSQFNDQAKTYHFYNDDFRTFVNYTLTNIDIRNVGVELAIEAYLGKGFSASSVAAIGQNFYVDRPKATITQDNRDDVFALNEDVFAKNLHTGGSPENAYTTGLSYRSKNFWFIYANVNYFDNIYIPFNPARRTAAAVDQIDGGSDLRKSILSQEKVSGQLTLDVSGGWSWKLNNKFKGLKKNTFLVLNVGVNNILNNKDLITGGYEQLRFDYAFKSVSKFDPKYYYASGTNFFINLIYRMN